ncbi:efflux RND transporter periplasmic adaptor subunit [Quisquiliibacterium transsilvanicum]|uniref:HlyD family efflux transporter periplasmic adaptor subunit n=1 Tax=Quisquiliibacterium transsilvanicum TaxID=1549638 RepID=A0A7W8HGG6_9BURK|nr:HlyD family efflux transporter periplasmic adaptor subunit [Quisquiliibacterium transsilvanicum]MBB5270750.1 hypothetical protein [Quisquiliibacterium transsilvanicum]
MKKLLALACIALASIAQAAPGAHGPDGEHLDAPVSSLPDRPARLPDGSVHVPMPAQRRLGLRTILAREGEAAATVELPGQVVLDPNAGGRVQTLNGGRIQPGPNGLPIAGQRVRKGELLAVVVHNADPLEIATRQATLAELRSSHRLALGRVDRLESLSGTVPRKEVQAARAEVESLAARSKAIKAGLATTERLLAPLSGVVSRADALAGQVAEPRDVLFEVLDPARALVVATTTDVSLGSRLGGATLGGLPDTQLRLVGTAPALREGVLPLTFRVSTREALPLAIGQPVTVVASLKEKVRGIVLPAQALTRSPANEPVVWVKAGAERYVAQPVRFHVLDARTIVVTQGLGADNRVVVQAAPLLAQIR